MRLLFRGTALPQFVALALSATHPHRRSCNGH